MSVHPTAAKGLSTSFGAAEWHIVTCEYLPRVGGISDYTSVLITMNPTPSVNAARAARRVSTISPRPTPCPTSTAAPADTPSGTMNVNAAMLSAT